MSALLLFPKFSPCTDALRFLLGITFPSTSTRLPPRTCCGHSRKRSTYVRPSSPASLLIRSDFDQRLLEFRPNSLSLSRTFTIPPHSLHHPSLQSPRPHPVIVTISDFIHPDFHLHTRMPGNGHVTIGLELKNKRVSDGKFHVETCVASFTGLDDLVGAFMTLV